MRFNLVTLFPEFFAGPLASGLMQKACDKGILSFAFADPRAKAVDKHRTVDDRPYGGSPGMVMQAPPLAETLKELGHRPFAPVDPAHRLILLSPAGRPFDQGLARELAEAGRKPGASLTLVCGRYEGVDARLEEIFPLECVSVGDFVLNGGEAAALCLVESVARLLPGFMGHEESGMEESFSAGLLEHPHYTRPECYEDLAVPGALLSGDHALIALWRRQAALRRSLERRPDLLVRTALDPDDLAFLAAIAPARRQRPLYCALIHYPVLDRDKNSVAVSLTNLDIHDIARSSCTYGLGAFYVVSPLRDQMQVLESLLAHWLEGAGARSNPDRAKALDLVRPAYSLAEVVESIKDFHGQAPFVCATSAGPLSGPEPTAYADLAQRAEREPTLLLFGTGRGLAPEVLSQCSAALPPIRPCGPYNHLSVRAAVAITLDRLVGDWR